MKYENGGELFPEALLKQIQRYVSGAYVYIPARADKRSWGETSGYKRYISQRNLAIRQRFRAGEGVDALSQAYCLSPETLRKIIYSKKEIVFMDYKGTLSSAIAYAKCGRLEDWVHAYLLSDGNNKEFSDGLRLFDRIYFGPVVMPMSLLSRCCGPEPEMKFRVDEAWFNIRVSHLTDVARTEKDIAPLIVHYVDHGFELNDGNHRFEAYQRLGMTTCHAILWFTEKEEYEEFLAKYPDIKPCFD